jgi:hypothetical protein
MIKQLHEYFEFGSGAEFVLLLISKMLLSRLSELDSDDKK